jgi:hypothetical protein
MGRLVWRRIKHLSAAGTACSNLLFHVYRSAAKFPLPQIKSKVNQAKVERCITSVGR